jgi:hypothetical protein
MLCFSSAIASNIRLFHLLVELTQDAFKEYILLLLLIVKKKIAALQTLALPP